MGTRATESFPAPRLGGHVAIITGGSSGIGRATCRAMASEGASVVVVGTDPDHIRSTVAELDQLADVPKSIGLALDVRQERDMQQMADRTLSQFGRIDYLVAAAGIGRSPASTQLVPYPVAHLPVSEWDAILDTNLKGVFLSNRAVLPAMIEQRKGTIVNISSSPAGQSGQAFAAAYCASKFGVIGMSESLAEEVARYGVRVQVVLPAVTDTPLVQGSTLTSRHGLRLSAACVADLIVYLVALPCDCVVESPVLASFGVT